MIPAPAGLCIARYIGGMGVRRLWLSVFILVFLAGFVSGQSPTDSAQVTGSADARDAKALAWLQDLYTPGVNVTADSVYFNDETRRIASDSMYRRVIYPPAYAWPIVQVLMQKKAIKPAVWHMINLFHADTSNRDLVLQMILPLDQVLEMDRVLVAAYYTYIAFDPEVYTIVDGKTVDVRRPDIAEQKLIATEAITRQIYAHRRSVGRQ